MSIMRVRQQDGTTVDIPLGKGGHSGADGKSAYEIAVDNGFEGTEAEWLESLKGKDGADGKDATDGVKSVNGKTPDENGNIEVPVGDGSGAVETVVEITLTEAVTSVIHNFTTEEIKKVNSAKKVSISYVVPNGTLEGVRFGIYTPAHYSYRIRFLYNYTMNQVGRHFARVTFDIEFAQYNIGHLYTGVYGINGSTSHIPKADSGLLWSNDSLRLETTGEIPFPIGTVIKVEVAS